MYLLLHANPNEMLVAVVLLSINSFTYVKTEGTPGDGKLPLPDATIHGTDLALSILKNSSSANTAVIDWIDFDFDSDRNESLPELQSNRSYVGSSSDLYQPPTDSDDSEYLFEGDMLPPANLSLEAFRRSIGYKAGDQVAVPLAGQDSIWPNKELPYLFAPDCSEALRKTWGKAADFFSHYTCINLRPKEANDEEYVYISQETRSCGSADVGRLVGLTNDLKIGWNCENSFLTVVHEIMHALGFIHEQSRPDRDSYVKIVFHNIISSEHNNFQRYERIKVNTLNLPYDFYSIMHYTWNAFSLDQKNKPTVIANDPKIVVGQQKFLSLQDITQIKMHYKCGDLESHKTAKCPSDKPFKCLHTIGCIAQRLVCDGNNDCGDNSDEQSCPKSQSSKTSQLWKLLQETALQIANKPYPPGFTKGRQSAPEPEEPEPLLAENNKFNDKCLACICAKSTPGCSNPPGGCSSEFDKCGLYQISLSYWKECGEPIVDGYEGTDENRRWEVCTKDFDCATTCVKNYVNKYAPSCGGKENNFNCEIATRVHYGGENGCRTISSFKFWKQVEKCMTII